MGRPIRIEYPGAKYHVINRGNDKKIIFLDDADKKEFLSILESVLSRYKWKCYSYCLMDNHYHLLIETMEANLSLGMKHLNGLFSQRFNKKNGKVGHLFQSRFKSILVGEDEYLRELIRYIELNPVRAGLVKDPLEWEWSSYRDLIRKKNIGLVGLDKEKVLLYFGNIAKYKNFIVEGIGKEEEILEKVKGKLILGSDIFVEKIKSYLKDKKGIKEHSKAERYLDRESLDDVFKGVNTKKERNEKICNAHLEYGYKLKDIAEFLGVHYSTVSKVFTNFKT